MGVSVSWKGYSQQEKIHSRLNFIGKIRDSLHDTIPFTQHEKSIIDSKEFQRLRRINQTAFTQYVFPGATHTRFEHSLGVMHVAGMLLSAIISNQNRLLDSHLEALSKAPKNLSEYVSEEEAKHGSLKLTQNALRFLENNPYLAQCLRFAALLHDCGHAPYSHSGERFMTTWKEFEEKLNEMSLPKWLKKGFQNKIIKLNQLGHNLAEKRIRHEVYTLLIVAKIFKSNDIMLSEQMGQDVCAVLDCSIDPNPSGDLKKSGLRTLLHEIVSGEVDADRMDYLLRDARECGIVYGFFDLGRILDSVGFYFNKQTHEYHLALRRSGVSAFEDYLRARWSMYQQVYFHKTVTACEAMLQNFNKNIPEFVLPLNLEDYLAIDDHNFPYYLDKKYDKKISSYAQKLMHDLIFNRKLWKRVYEEYIPKNSLRNAPSLCPAILKYLKNSEIPSEVIENSTNLTRFSPKGREKLSKNNFKIIVKDVHSLRYLEPVENHSNLINRVDEDIVIRRIYISRFDQNENAIFTDKIQKKISEKIIDPENE